MNKKMSGQERADLIFCISGLVLFFLMMFVPLWDIVTEPRFRSPIGNLLGSIFLAAAGLVGFVLDCWVFVVLTRSVTTIVEDSGSIIVQPRFGKPIRIDLSRPPRAHIVRASPYLGTPSKKALLFLKPKIFVVLESHAAWDKLTQNEGQKLS